MSGVSIVTNNKGVRTSILVDLPTLRRTRRSGAAVVKYLAELEALEDIIDVELSRGEATDSWESVKQQLQAVGKLSHV
jgi:hypothetical protein